MVLPPPLHADEMERYARHLSLPDFSLDAQKNLKNAHILVVGAGGLGAASLPYLAGAGIGQITICDDDTISLTNLHRQTIYKTSETGQSKAQIAALYLQSLNPDVRVNALTERLRHCEEAERPVQQSASVNMDCFAPLAMTEKYDLILDGSDNFATKALLNRASIRNKIPLISASVNQYAGQIGIFAGYAADAPCYHCLFPELPSHARNCNEAGVIGTAAGITGLYQAHLAILFLAGLNDIKPGQFLQLDYQTMRNQMLHVPKEKSCPHCAHQGKNFISRSTKETNMIELISMDELRQGDEAYVIVDVRTHGEIAADPVADAIHIELSEIPVRYNELPAEKLLAFVCVGNIRSRQAAEYISALGFENVVVLDKFSL